VREIDALDGLMGVPPTARDPFQAAEPQQGSRGTWPRAPRRTAPAIAARSRICWPIRPACRLWKRRWTIFCWHPTARWRAWHAPTVAELPAAAVVLTPGVPARHDPYRRESTPAGRVGEAPAVALAQTLSRLELPLERLKTVRGYAAAAGTGAQHRLGGLQADPGDAVPSRSATLTRRIELPQVECRITATTPATHALIRDNCICRRCTAARFAGPAALLPVDRRQGVALRGPGAATRFS